jgi:SNF2 family DNA or RNA helicase
MANPAPLHFWQAEAVEWLLGRSANSQARHRFAKPPKFAWAEKPTIWGALLCMAMGMGKTRTTIEYLKRKHVPGASTLIVIPNSALHTWKSEVPMWWPEAKMLVLHSSVTKIDQVTREELDSYDIVVVTFNLMCAVAAENMPDEVFQQRPRTFIDAITDVSKSRGRKHNYNRPLYPLAPYATHGKLLVLSKKWTDVVVDESHAIANMQTKRFQSLMTLCSSFTLCLTGTPMRNRVGDLYAQFKFLGLHEATCDEHRFEKLYDHEFFAMFLTYKDVNHQLPTCINIMHQVSMTPAQHELYSYVLGWTQEAMARLQDKDLDQKLKFADILAMFTFLRLVSSMPAALCAEYLDAMEGLQDYQQAYQKVLQLDHISRLVRDSYGEGGMFCPKLNKTMELILATTADTQVIVFSMFKKPMKLLQERCEQVGVTSLVVNGDVTGLEREDALTAFKRDKSIKVLIISFQVGAESLNLANANVAIFIDTWFCPATLAQAKARIHRFGQTKACVVHQLVSKASIEEGIYDIVDRKLHDIDLFLGKKPEKLDVTRETLYAILHDKLEKKRKRDLGDVDGEEIDDNDINNPNALAYQRLWCPDA